MGRRPKTYDPAAATAERLRRLEAAAAQARADDADPARWGVAAEQLALPRHAEVQATRDGRGRIAHAHRTDVFERLHERGSLTPAQLSAVRRLERDMGARTGAYGAPADLLKVDSSTRPEGATQRMLAAGERVEAAFLAAGPRSALLLRALLEPAVLTGETIACVRRQEGLESGMFRAAAGCGGTRRCS